MVAAVSEVFARDGRLIVEAGTGTGKSLAYLIPAACHAVANADRVVVSTATINLQEQLAEKGHSGGAGAVTEGSGTGTRNRGVQGLPVEGPAELSLSEAVLCSCGCRGL